MMRSMLTHLSRTPVFPRLVPDNNTPEDEPFMEDIDNNHPEDMPTQPTVQYDHDTPLIADLNRGSQKS